MAITQLANLDFEDIKTSIKDYIRANTNFTDYDYEGSTLSLIIDMLAYNTYLASYNANMVSNEAFIDGATLRENVVSLARNIGYLPRSRVSAKSTIRFSVSTDDFPVKPLSLTLKKGSVVLSSSEYASQSYTFCIPEDITELVVEGDVNFTDIEVYEGVLIEQEFIVSEEYQTSQRFILNNVGIDYSTIRVTVRESVFSSDSEVFNLSKSILEIDGNSSIFFIQEVSDERYELIFGDGVFGKKLNTGNAINVSYIVSNGEEGNGLSRFKFIGNLVTDANAIVARDVSTVQTIEPSEGGSAIEPVSSIKNYAGRIYSAQNRAVTANDYEAIVRKIYPEAESLSAFGGEKLNPPKFGKVFIAVKPKVGSFLSSSVKENIKNELRQYSIAGIVPEIIDTKFLYIEASSIVYYNPNRVSSSDVAQDSIIDNLTLYSKSEVLNSYGSRFKYSQLSTIIDNSHPSITSNILSIQIRRDMRAVTNRIAEYEICFGNKFKVDRSSGGNIRSSAFRVSGLNYDVYLTDVPSIGSPQQQGDIVLIKDPGNTDNMEIVRRDVGRVFYEEGEVYIYAINIVSTALSQNIIQISSTPRSNDVIGLQDLYLQLDTRYSNINMLVDNIESGADPTGSNFLFTSTTNPIVRK